MFFNAPPLIFLSSYLETKTNETTLVSVRRSIGATANVPSTMSNKEWPVATKAYIKYQNMNPVSVNTYYMQGSQAANEKPPTRDMS